jgi:hypothetical protein
VHYQWLMRSPSSDRPPWSVPHIVEWRKVISWCWHCAQTDVNCFGKRGRHRAPSAWLPLIKPEEQTLTLTKNISEIWYLWRSQSEVCWLMLRNDSKLLIAHDSSLIKPQVSLRSPQYRLDGWHRQAASVLKNIHVIGCGLHQYPREIIPDAAVGNAWAFWLISMFLVSVSNELGIKFVSKSCPPRILE